MRSAAYADAAVCRNLRLRSCMHALACGVVCFVDVQNPLEPALLFSSYRNGLEATNSMVLELSNMEVPIRDDILIRCMILK